MDQTDLRDVPTDEQPAAGTADDGGVARRGTKITCSTSETFAEFMRQANGSIFVTTYQAGKVAMLGWNGTRVGMTLRDYSKPLGLAVQGGRMALATRDAVVLFQNAPALAPDYSEEEKGRYDSLFLARSAYFTGPLAVHDVAFIGDDIWIVNTACSCLATLSHEHNFVARWKPPFISQVIPEDRCHLNGMAIVNGKPRYVTALGQTNEAGRWRDTKANGGIIMEVPSGEVVMRGLSMPHGPRWHDNKLWFLNSGTGELCIADVKAGKYDRVCALQGYLRGLSFVGHYALVGLCMIREKHTFGGLPVQERHKQLLCGIAIVDLRTGRQVGLCKFGSGVQELYEVKFVPGTRQPMMRSGGEDRLRHAISVPSGGFWMRVKPDSPDSPATTPVEAKAAPGTSSDPIAS